MVMSMLVFGNMRKTVYCDIDVVLFFFVFVVVVVVVVVVAHHMIKCDTNQS